LTSLGSQALGKLVRVLGPEQGRAMADETLRQIGLPSLVSADDCLRFGEALIARGGLLEAIGRAIKIQALLNGAGKRAS
jgi:hypothetical protein